jgi:hypothetical protein
MKMWVCDWLIGMCVEVDDRSVFRCSYSLEEAEEKHENAKDKL